MLKRTIPATMLIRILSEIVKEHGDLPVYLKDPDTRYRMEIGILVKEENLVEEYPKRIEIRASYYGNPKGDVNEYEQKYAQVHPNNTSEQAQKQGD